MISAMPELSNPLFALKQSQRKHAPRAVAV